MNKITLENNYLSSNLTHLLKINNLSPLEFAYKVEGAAYETIARIKRDPKSNPTIKTIMVLCNYFDVNVNDLLCTDLTIEKELPIEKDEKIEERIPIADWADINNWENSEKHLLVDVEPGSASFALFVEKDMGEIAKDSYIIINTTIEPKDNCYVLIQNLDNQNVYLRRFIKEDVYYLESLLVDKSLTQYNPSDSKILGVIIGYQKLKLFS